MSRWKSHVSLAVAVVLSIDLFAILALGGGTPVAVAVRLLAVAAILWLWLRWRILSDRFLFALILLFLLSVYHFHATTNRRVADGFFYYAYVQSFWKDFDLHFDDEYAEYGMDERGSRFQPTVTGHARNTFPAGPAIFWSPFFLLGELVGRAKMLFSDETVNLSGSGRLHWNAVSLGSLIYGFAAVVLVYSSLRRYFLPPYAFGAAALMWLATSHYFYMVYQPIMSHAVATFVASLFIWLWDRNRLSGHVGNAAMLGLIGGLSASVRWQNGLLWTLPLIDWLIAVFKRDGKVVRAGFAFLGGLSIGVLPQLLAWKILYDRFVFTHAPIGAAYVRWTDPRFWEMLFSSRHGLLTWTPVFWLAWIGLVPLLRTRRLVFWAMAATLALMAYVNACVWDWWGGGSFSGRRFDAVLPILAFGLAASVEKLHRLATRWPALSAVGGLAFFPVWNLLLMEQYHRHRIPADRTVSFADMAGGNVDLLFEKIGYPFAWPVNWLHARANDLTFREHDLLFGSYLFMFHRSDSAFIDLGKEDPRFVGFGWSPPQLRSGRWVRVTRADRARLFLPLEVASAIELTFTASVRPAAADVGIVINEKPAGSFRVTPGFDEYTVRVPALYWKEGVNRLDLTPRFAEPKSVLLLEKIGAHRSVVSPSRLPGAAQGR